MISSTTAGLGAPIPEIPMQKRHLLLFSFVVGCSGTSPGSTADAANVKTVVINEVFASGRSSAATSWVKEGSSDG
jgi:hypothetical protein